MQNSSKKKELELRERELALKEKQLAMDSIQKLKPIDSKTSETSNKSISLSNADKFLGIYNYKDEDKHDVLLKITKDNSGRFNIKKGTKEGSKISWGNMDNSVGNGIDLKFIKDNLVGQYRDYDGHTFESSWDTKFNIELKTDDILLFKEHIHHNGSGENSNESFEAIRVK